MLDMLDTNGGWITEDGAYIPSRYYNHVKSAHEALPVGHPVMEWIAPRREALEEYIKQEQEVFFDSVPEGEHAGAHRIEIWSEDQESQFRELFGKFISERGWLRIVNRDKSLYVEGTTASVDKHKLDLKFLASLFGANSPSKTPKELTITTYTPRKIKFDLPESVITGEPHELDI